MSNESPIACPNCGALPGKPCERIRMGYYHEERIAAEQAYDEAHPVIAPPAEPKPEPRVDFLPLSFSDASGHQ